MNKQIELTEEEFKKIEDVINNFLQKGAANDSPKFVVLTGSIASGKTTIRKEKYSKDYVLIDSGELFDSFDAKNNENTEKKSGHMMIAGIELVKRSITEKRNIVIEITADTPEKGDKLKQIIDKMSSLGYKAEIEAIYCDVEECQRRNAKGRDNMSSYYSTDETLHYFMVAFENL